MTDEPEPDRSDCGQLLDDHDPLPKAPPLTSWMASRTSKKYLPKSKRTKTISIRRDQP